MAEHIRHTLARQGMVVRPDNIVTLSRFVKPLAADVPQVSRPLLERLTAGELEANPPAAYAPLQRSRGLRRMIASLIEEASTAGASPDQIHRAAGTPAAEAFADVFGRVHSAVAASGKKLRAERLAIAASRVEPGSTPNFLDGFYSLTPAETEVVAALRPAGVTLRLPDWSGAVETRSALRRLGLGEQHVDDSRPAPSETSLFHAASQHEEAQEIARRILELNAAGRPFREIGIVMRSEWPYRALLESTLRRFGIPARFYFQQTFEGHALPRFYNALLDAVIEGWDYDHLRNVIGMRLSGFGGRPEGDTLDFQLAGRAPGAGLPEELHAWRDLSRWRGALLKPAEWAVELRTLRSAVRLPQIMDGVTHEQIFAWRELASALALWDTVLEEAAALCPEAPVLLPDFRRELHEVIANTEIDHSDQRRNVVHVLDVYEARQWSLPVVFVCGLVERGFPRYHSEHPILNDAQREKLRADGIVLRTSSERQKEESFLFEIAATTASDLLVLSHPRTNAKGDEVLPSFFLNTGRVSGFSRVAAQPARPKPSLPLPAVHPVRIQSPDLLKWLRKNTTSLSPTAIETYLQCPFQFFGRQILKLAQRPESPRDRLDFLLQGNILHQTLAESHGSPLFVEEIFSRLFSEVCRENSVPESARTEKIRLELLANLRRFLESPPLTGGRVAGVEKSFDLTLRPGLRIRGKIDRVIEITGRGMVVIDYKYSTRERIRDRVKSHQRGELVQGGLYLWAAEKLFREPSAGMLYCGLRGEVAWGGWHLPVFGWSEIGESWDQPALNELIAKSVEATEAVFEGIASGEIAPQPADTNKCLWCEYRDCCRIEQQTAGGATVAGQ